MDSNHKLCSVCSKRHISKPSIEWCSECNQAFCTECKECHSLMTTTEDHMTIPIASLDELRTTILSIGNICEDHREKYELYCQHHNKPLCLICIEDHSECKDIKSINKIAKNIKTSESFNEVRMSLEDLDTNINKMIAEIKSNQNSTEDCCSVIIQRICEIREKVNKHLDTLEIQLKGELSKLENKTKNDVQLTLKYLEEKKLQNGRKQKQMEDITKYASDLQTFLGLRHLSSDIIADESFLRSLVENGSLDEVEIAFELDENITSFSNVISKFGSVQLQKIPGNFCLESQKGKQAQTTGNTKSINNLVVQLLNTINTKANSISGCDFLPDGNMVFSNYSPSGTADFIAVFTSNGIPFDNISLKPNYAFDVVTLDEETVVVTSPKCGECSIMSINIHSKEVTQIKTECYYYSITFSDGKLLSNSLNRNIQTIDTKSGKILSTIKINLSKYTSLTSFESKLYFCDPSTNTISCCDMEGSTIWSFKDDTVIKKPSGIAVDGMGNVYVTNKDLNNVIVISPDGLNSRQLLSESNGLKRPRAIQCNKRKNRLLVANEEAKAFLFDISH
ncbi:uncharacterized protein LOC127720409 [Mytilus californianus]|uniref:uncharacterized protein LOC127720409 n=1 Tax=Mytilus californianus TaxID=6549 RepID=UPI002245C8F7|nr:uncharacterized protein LOC127720409 [Mytilus californianus]